MLLIILCFCCDTKGWKKFRNPAPFSWLNPYSNHGMFTINFGRSLTSPLLHHYIIITSPLYHHYITMSPVIIIDFGRSYCSTIAATVAGHDRGPDLTSSVTKTVFSFFSGLPTIDKDLTFYGGSVVL